MHANVIFTLVIITTINRAPNEKRKLTNELVTVDRANIYLGTLIFLSNEEFPITDPIARVLDSRIKVNIILPVSK